MMLSEFHLEPKPDEGIPVALLTRANVTNERVCPTTTSTVVQDILMFSVLISSSSSSSSSFVDQFPSKRGEKIAEPSRF
jgi:hypothetical protein